MTLSPGCSELHTTLRVMRQRANVEEVYELNFQAGDTMAFLSLLASGALVGTFDRGLCQRHLQTPPP
jgi:hypothetical protein